MSLADTPFTGQAVPGVQVARAWSAACVRNEGKARAGTAPREEAGARGSAPSGCNREALSTVAARAGGPARSSAEVPVTGAERRGRLIWTLFARATGALPWEEASEHVRHGRKAVCHTEAAGVAGVEERQGEQGSRRGGRRDHRGVREGSCG